MAQDEKRTPKLQRWSLTFWNTCREVMLSIPIIHLLDTVLSNHGWTTSSKNIRIAITHHPKKRKKTAASSQSAWRCWSAACVFHDHLSEGSSHWWWTIVCRPLLICRFHVDSFSIKPNKKFKFSHSTPFFSCETNAKLLSCFFLMLGPAMSCHCPK